MMHGEGAFAGGGGIEVVGAPLSWSDNDLSRMRTKRNKQNKPLKRQ